MPIENIELNVRNGRTPYFNLIKKKQLAQKRIFKEKFKQFNRFFKSHGLKFAKICLTKAEIEDDNDFEIKIEEKNSNFSELCQRAKDEALMSKRAYNQLRKTLFPIAKLASIKKCDYYKNSLNSFWSIKPNNLGHFIEDPLSKIKYVCEKFLERNNYTEKIFNILLHGDGFSLTRTHTNLLNFCFSLIDDVEKSCKEVYTLGIFIIEKESHEIFSESLKELISKLKEITQINIKDQLYNINFFSGGDLKWTSLCYGINNANSNFPCPWCTWENNKIEIDKIKKNTLIRKIRDEKLLNKKIKEMEEEMIEKMFANKYNLRTHEESFDLRNLRNNERLGYTKEPLFTFIPFEKSTIDILHLYLRVTDKLLKLLFNHLDQLEIQHKGLTLIKTFCDFLKNECKITNPSYIVYETKDNVQSEVVKLRSLNQNEREKMLEELFRRNVDVENEDIENEDIGNEDIGNEDVENEDTQNANARTLSFIFPINVRDDIKLLRFDYLFYNFKIVIKKVKDFKNFNRVEIETILKKWLRNYIKIENQITPYIHIFCFHLCDFVEKYNNINSFSMQAPEKLNHVTKIHYARQTNRHTKNNKFTLTLLQKANRMEIFHLNKKK